MCGAFSIFSIMKEMMFTNSLHNNLPELELAPDILLDEHFLSEGNWHTLLYNCNCHSAEEVVEQLLKATDHSLQKCIEIMLEAHFTGRAVAYAGSQCLCQRCTGILCSIGLRAETIQI